MLKTNLTLQLTMFTSVDCNAEEKLMKEPLQNLTAINILVENLSKQSVRSTIFLRSKKPFQFPYKITENLYFFKKRSSLGSLTLNSQDVWGNEDSVIEYHSFPYEHSGQILQVTLFEWPFFLGLARYHSPHWRRLTPFLLSFSLLSISHWHMFKVLTKYSVMNILE